MSKLIIESGLSNILKQLNCLFISKSPLHYTTCVYKDIEVVPSLDDKLTKDEHFTSLVSRPRLPIITSRKLAFVPKFPEPRQVWVESLDTIEEEKLGLIDLHPHIFGSPPRLDILHQNLMWQKKYRKVNYDKVKNRAEMRGGGRKPWRQKGLGKARHGSIRSPLFLGGGVSHGPRGFKSYFFMLPFYTRVLGLRTALSIKLAQDDLHVIDSLKLPTEDSQFLAKLAETRNWGISVLFVDDTDIMPRNITLASEELPGFTLMPVYGLNVYSMLRHDTLVLTLAAVEKIEERLLYHMHKLDFATPKILPVSLSPKDAVNPELVKQMAAAYQRPKER